MGKIIIVDFNVSGGTGTGTANGGKRKIRLQADWNAMLDDALAEATLQRPASTGYVTQGKTGLHSEHLGFLLAEMQSLARAHPGAQW